ncbi:hypothetical protein ANN_08561 [Periplaneta americana]|uniref:Transposase n=1 Tax=Periplaneta americana TaxID=6978 RepID=A0ABQ8T3C3_PERAM|nr:hypothetical protein ANN_08561 [Periplaneta americana]
MGRRSSSGRKRPDDAVIPKNGRPLALTVEEEQKLVTYKRAKTAQPLAFIEAQQKRVEETRMRCATSRPKPWKRTAITANNPGAAPKIERDWGVLRKKDSGWQSTNVEDIEGVQDRKTFVRLHYRLCEYGKFNSPGLGRGRPRSTTPEVQEEILEAVNMTPSISTRRALSPADYPARFRFCQWFLQQCGVNPNFRALVLFTDEAQFTRDGITNFHNQHVWEYENPRSTVPSHHQVRFSLNMWASIIDDRLVGPHVLVNRLTGQAYTNFLENTIPHVLEDTPLINRQHIHFMHDGAPAHFSRTARRYLDRRFPDRWIGRGGPIAWPPRSPDLNPLDFYLWDHLKSLVYSSPVPDLESLRNRIVTCSEDIRNTPGVWDRVRRSMRHRCEVCIQAGGGNFEHLL